MARRRSRRGGRFGRANNRGMGREIVTRDASYSLPITEPCNFVEFSLSILANSQITYAQLLTALFVKAPNSQIKKFRLTSLVMEPINVSANAEAGPITQGELTMGLSGNTYWSPNTSKPMRLRFREEYGKDGMWHVLQGASTLPASDPATGTLPVCTLDISNGTNGASAEIRFRIAWSDLD